MGANNQMACDFCSVPYDPVATRWLCPNCHMKTNCCDGAPCEIVEVKTTTSNQLFTLVVLPYKPQPHLGDEEVRYLISWPLIL